MSDTPEETTEEEAPETEETEETEGDDDEAVPEEGTDATVEPDPIGVTTTTTDEEA